ncbi:helix-turn-helix transcriptional regulator [Shimazuella kribbensis]|uniref:helix-turn-helix transcriptional regulator n=1 Tax=Shimazuella kribbensis TaxID=139808 RepID=UPI0003F6F215|nr:YafY family protein [Shimazuella kribbensis]
MRGDRLVSILLLLQSYGKVTASELAKKLEVSQRTIYRDMDALSATGIPVYANRGKDGGWSLLEGYRTSLTGLKEAEIQALLLPASVPLLDDLGLTQTSQDARNKLLASLPVDKERITDVWNRIHIDTSTWRKRKKEKNSAFEIIKKAIWKQNKLNIQYQRANGEKTEEIVCPLGLVAKGSNWYFVASKKNEAIRSYRVSRIRIANPIAETFQRPPSFDLACYWENSTNSFLKNLPTYEVQAMAHSSIYHRLTFAERFVQITKVGVCKENGWIPIHLTFQTENEAKGYLLGFADQIKVMEPKELKDKILKMAQSILKMYHP